MSGEKAILWDAPMMRRLRIAYDAAVSDGRSQFTFDGNVFLTSYAKYLLEFLQEKLHG